MSEDAAAYTVRDLSTIATTDQEDTAYQHLAERVATHYRTLRAGGIRRRDALDLTDSFQDYLLCIAGVGDGEVML